MGKHREFWITHWDKDTDFIYDHDPLKLMDMCGREVIHVIEIEAVRELEAKLRIATDALEKTPCTGNGDVHILSCYKCAMLAKINGESE